jgi:hypothetical protein
MGMVMDAMTIGIARIAEVKVKASEAQARNAILAMDIEFKQAKDIETIVNEA